MNKKENCQNSSEREQHIEVKRTVNQKSTSQKKVNQKSMSRKKQITRPSPLCGAEKRRIQTKRLAWIFHGEVFLRAKLPK